MDGRLAVLFFVVGLTDMQINDCKMGCLARSPAQQAISLSFGDVIFQEKSIGQEAYVRYDMGTAFGPFQPAVGLSVTDSNDVWVGLGATHTTRFWERPSGVGGYAQLHFMPGVYVQGSGPDLGHDLEFRSGAEIGYQAKSGLRMGLSFDHRSNGGISPVNPGMETLQLRVSVPLN
ncbi:acyloxyacyl hydrolase [Planktotalea arctica]|uniref:acyloxyacyl hydrolase n=1 Tax=Planktotalea arctica TaxID=1481893 RepID=UPI000A176135|nr:acyloxyacyl hydrolase [Planktotalea arctica]